MREHTKPTRLSSIKRDWHLIDLEGKTLGRTATAIAILLMGKRKPYFVKNLDCGDFVVAINAKAVRVSGKKEDLKKYYRYSGYPGGLKVETLKELRERKPQEIIRHAVLGMLPQNKLRDRMIERLLIFEGEKHPYEDKFKSQSFGFARGEKSKVKN